MQKRKIYFFLYFTIVLACGCRGKAPNDEEEEVSAAQVRTPVTVTSISNEPLTEYVELQATSAFMQDNVVKSNINGYVKSVNAKIGQHVNAGQILFTLITKEAQSIGNAVNRLDSSFHFSGISKVGAAQPGFITALNHQVGDYVQDGEQLAVVSNSNSFGFVLNLPYELHKYLSLNKAVDVILPDSTHLQGIVVLYMPVIDSVSQTQQVLIKVESPERIPENLIARVRFIKSQRTNMISLPKQAVLSDESQTNFWVMKMIDSVTAIKVPVKKGTETGNRVEILQPQFSPADKILMNGNYGLPDTAKVRVINGQ